LMKKRTREDMTGGNAQHRDPLLQFEEHMRAADELIDSLEGEVVELRRDLEEARGTLQVAQQEMAARSRALEDLNEEDRSREAAEEEVRKLRAEITAVRQHNADEQLRMSNKHIADMEVLRQDLEEQRCREVAAVESDSKIGALREEFRKERMELEERHRLEIDELKRASKQWEEQLREGYRELEERHNTELEELRREHRSRVEALQAKAEVLEEDRQVEVEALRIEAEKLKESHEAEAEELRRRYHAEVEQLRAEAEGEKIELERALREELGRGHKDERRALIEQHAEELQSLRSAAASRELQLQKQLQETVEAHRAEVQQLQIEAEKAASEAEERRKREIREIKSLAEERERELRRTQGTRSGEEREAAERRIAAIKAQREADINSLRERNSEETAKIRRDLEARLAGAEERHKSEVARIKESLLDAKPRTSEAIPHGERPPMHGEAKDVGHVDEALERRLAESEAERTRLEEHTAELRDALEESRTVQDDLRYAFKEARTAQDELRESLESSAGDRADSIDHDDGSAVRVINRDLERRLAEAEKARVVAEERAGDLVARLRETEAVSKRLEQELEKAMENLKRSSDPEQRLRAGLALFNESDHTRTVSSISKALGLPKVHVSPDGGSLPSTKKPVITFVWGEMAWRRYVSDPTDGVEEPRVYLIGAGDDPFDIRRPGLEPNARMDARGRLILGVQAF
jgi:chromosome segregation ATPase